jgi:hypothetical protein
MQLAKRVDEVEVESKKLRSAITSIGCMDSITPPDAGEAL